MRVAFLLFALAQPAAAETWFACDFGDARSLAVTHDDTSATYAFTHPTSSLTLTRPLDQVDLTPWPGIDRTIWEEVTFHNAGHGYTVFAAITRIYPEEDDGEVLMELSGGILVTQGEDEIARLDCLPGTIDFPWSTILFDAKEAAGQCFDPVNRSWAAC